MGRKNGTFVRVTVTTVEPFRYKHLYRIFQPGPSPTPELPAKCGVRADVLIKIGATIVVSPAADFVSGERNELNFIALLDKSTQGRI
jgi:hypothetical protein